jgi:pyruvate dehydrogenase E1 component beta subunit
MRELSYAEALVEALTEVMEEDERVYLIGSYFLGLHPRRVLLDRLREKFSTRVMDPPISEIGYCGLGIGAAMNGLRPIVDVATASFLFQAWPQVVNEAANAFYMTGGQTRVPVVFHLLHGLRGGGAAQHSHSPQAMLWNSPGLEIVLPSSPRDVKGLLKSAVRSENPTIFVDHVRLFDLMGPVPVGDGPIPFGQAEVKRQGGDVTVVATSYMVPLALRVAEELEREGIEVEVVDPRTLVPLDEEAILTSVGKTGRLVVVDECHRRCGVAAEISALVSESEAIRLKAPIKRVVTEDVPVPFSPPLEAHIGPSEQKVARAVRTVVEGH